uniref:Uncharacterized protein n=1 Tax=Steinernema glaseri TaxID=37863 RepID=A0A1I7ZV06_9BILA
MLVTNREATEEDLFLHGQDVFHAAKRNLIRGSWIFGNPTSRKTKDSASFPIVLVFVDMLIPARSYDSRKGSEFFFGPSYWKYSVFTSTTISRNHLFTRHPAGPIAPAYPNSCGLFGSRLCPKTIEKEENTPKETKGYLDFGPRLRMATSIYLITRSDVPGEKGSSEWQLPEFTIASKSEASTTLMVMFDTNENRAPKRVAISFRLESVASIARRLSRNMALIAGTTWTVTGRSSTTYPEGNTGATLTPFGALKGQVVGGKGHCWNGHGSSPGGAEHTAHAEVSEEAGPAGSGCFALYHVE